MNHRPDFHGHVTVTSRTREGNPQRPVTCCCHQRAEPDAHALHFQIHDREAALGHQLFELLSQLQGQGHNEEVPPGMASPVFAPTLTHSAPGPGGSRSLLILFAYLWPLLFKWTKNFTLFVTKKYNCSVEKSRKYR